MLVSLFDGLLFAQADLLYGVCQWVKCNVDSFKHHDMIEQLFALLHGSTISPKEAEDAAEKAGLGYLHAEFFNSLLCKQEIMVERNKLPGLHFSPPSAPSAIKVDAFRREAVCYGVGVQPVYLDRDLVEMCETSGKTVEWRMRVSYRCLIMV